MFKKKDKKLQEFMETTFQSSAIVLDRSIVEVKAPDDQVYHLMSDIGKYTSKDTVAYFLHLIERIFDKNYSEDKETMKVKIQNDLILNGVNSFGMITMDKESERVRIGKQIRQLRENKGMEAKQLAYLANIDPANLSRIEQGKYSVGLDVLYRILFVLGAHVELVLD